VSVTGGYLGRQIRLSAVRPIIVYREVIFREVLPAFANLSERANRVATEYFNRVGAEPPGEYESVDMADVAEAANAQGLAFCQAMAPVRQTMLNLLAAGLYHSVEQHLADSCRDASFTVGPPNDTKLSVVANWYHEHFILDLSTLPSWGLIDELRNVANTVKHAEGPAANRLRALRPELFRNPDYAAVDEEMRRNRIEPSQVPVFLPLAGTDLFVSEDLLRTYCQAAESFCEEIAAHFDAHDSDVYPR
jgi:hypothetical protein